MSPFKWIFPFLVCILRDSAKGDDFFSSALSVQDRCTDICLENAVLLPIFDQTSQEQKVCQRGCRFFNIVSFKNELDLNLTKKECFLSCEESYISEKESAGCKLGCEFMKKKREGDMSNFIIFAEQDNMNNIMLFDPDLELLENDILSDPSIRTQLEVGYNIAYKIPEKRVRTMPLKDVKEEIQRFFIQSSNANNGDWLDCASRNSGIPRWILLTAILSAVLLALWLSFSTDKKATVETDTEKCDLISQEVIPEKDPKLFNEEVNFSSPPKYTVESEKV